LAGLPPPTSLADASTAGVLHRALAPIEPLGESHATSETVHRNGSGTSSVVPARSPLAIIARLRMSLWAPATLAPLGYRSRPRIRTPARCRSREMA
jgi:hypothetical protein